MKIHKSYRILSAAKGLNVNADEIFIKVITSVPVEDTITTKELDKLVYEIAASYTGSHHDYSRLASSVAISAYHKETNPSFSETMSLCRSGSRTDRSAARTFSCVSGFIVWHSPQ